METIKLWFESHFTELLAIIGAGGGGGILGKKLKDKEQDKKLNELANQVIENKGDIVIIKMELETNTKFDHQLRDDIREGRAETNLVLKEIKDSIKSINEYLLNHK